MLIAMNSWINTKALSEEELRGLTEEAKLDAEKLCKNEGLAQEEIHYIEQVDFSPLKKKCSISPAKLEKLRELCALWDVDLKPAKITSHRKFIGPLIVGVKKALFPIVRVFLKDFLRQQRSFNGAVVAALSDVSNDIHRES